MRISKNTILPTLNSFTLHELTSKCPAQPGIFRYVSLYQFVSYGLTPGIFDLINAGL